MEGKLISEASETVWWLDLTDADPVFYDRSTLVDTGLVAQF